MRIVVSPYHLTTREPPAMAALLLGDEVLTLMPAPADGADRSTVTEALGRVPGYLDMMQSWRWSEDLWRAGVVVGASDGLDAADDVREAYRRIASGDDFAPLRAFMHTDLFENDDQYLRAVTRDIVRGGPDPAVSVPLAAGLDRFAARHGLIVARASAQSVAQRAEESHATKIVAFIAPVLMQAGSTGLASAREALADTLITLRDAIDDVAVHATSLNGNGRDHAGLRDAARRYAEAFDAARADFDEPEDEVRLVDGLVSITLVSMPIDVVLRASVHAARAVLGGRERTSSAPTTLPVLYDAQDAMPVVSMIVRPVGQRTS